MAGEFYSAEKAQIKSVEQEAKTKENADLQSAIQKNADVFYNQVDEAGKAYAEAKNVTDPVSRAEIDRDKQEVSAYLIDVANKGKEILQQDKKEGAEPPISALASQLKSFMELTKADMPKFRQIEESRKEHEKLKPNLAIIASLKNPEKLKQMPVKKRSLFIANLAPQIRALSENIKSMDPNGGSEVLRAFYMQVAGEIQAAHADLGEVELMCLSQQQKEENNLLELSQARENVESATKDVTGLSQLRDIVLNGKSPDFEKDVAKLSADTGPIMDKLTGIISALRSSKISNPDYESLQQSIIQKAQIQLNQVADIKQYCSTRKKLLESSDLKKYFEFTVDGNIKGNGDFEKLSPEQKKEWTEKVQRMASRVKTEIALDMDEKTVTPEEKEFISGKKKIFGGDMIGAKADLLAFYNREIGKQEPKNQAKLAACKELLKQIAKKELTEMAERLKTMKEAIGGRYEWHLDPASNSVYGAKNKEMANIAIERMASLLVQAEQMIDSGQVLTVNDAKVQFLNMKPKDDADPISGLQTGFAGFGVKDRALFDVFEQQRLLSEKDPVKKENIAKLAKMMREHGYGDNARQLYEEYFKSQLEDSRKEVKIENVKRKFLNGEDGEKNTQRLAQQLEKWKEDYKKKHNNADPSAQEQKTASDYMENAMVNLAYQKAVKLATYATMKDAKGPDGDIYRDVYGGKVVIDNFGQNAAFFTDEEWNELPAKTTIGISVTMASAGVGSGAVAAAGGVVRGILGEAVTGSMLASTATVAGTEIAVGRGAAAFGSLAVEGAGFVAAQDRINHLINTGKWGSDFNSFSEYAKAVGHNMLVLGALKGVGAGFGKLQGSFQAGKIVNPGVVESAVGGSARTLAEGFVLTGISAGTAWASGEKFGDKEVIRGVAENVVFSLGIQAAHGLGGEGAHGESSERVSKEEVAEGQAVEAAISVGRPQTIYREQARVEPVVEVPTHNLQPHEYELIENDEVAVSDHTAKTAIEHLDTERGSLEFNERDLQQSNPEAKSRRIIEEAAQGETPEAVEATFSNRLNVQALREYVRNKPESFRQDLAKAFEQHEKGITNESEKLDDVLLHLKEHDPEAYDLLKANINNPDLSPNYIEAMIRGDKVTFSDQEGKNITVYKGKFFGKGSFKEVSYAAYTVDGGKELHFQVIAKPVKGEENNFIKEGEIAKGVRDLGIPELNQALHIGEKHIIYESGKDFTNLKDASKEDKLIGLLATLKGAIKLHKLGLVHRDLKCLNTIIYTDSSGRRVGQIIDNSPLTPAAMNERYKHGGIDAHALLFQPEHALTLLGTMDGSTPVHVVDNLLIGYMTEHYVLNETYSPELETALKDASDILQNTQKGPDPAEILLPQLEHLIERELAQSAPSEKVAGEP